jgi:hypothetical protein
MPFDANNYVSQNDGYYYQPYQPRPYIQVKPDVLCTENEKGMCEKG